MANWAHMVTGQNGKSATKSKEMKTHLLQDILGKAGDQEIRVAVTLLVIG